MTNPTVTCWQYSTVHLPGTAKGKVTAICPASSLDSCNELYGMVHSTNTVQCTTQYKKICWLRPTAHGPNWPCCLFIFVNIYKWEEKFQGRIWPSIQYWIPR